MAQTTLHSRLKKTSAIILAFLSAAGAQQSVLINFDDTTVPVNFNNTINLTNEYRDRGVVFSGPQKNYGLGIVPEEGNFNITGYSPKNFLAFNTGAIYSNGGIPEGPETLSFNPPVEAVKIMAGHSMGGTVVLSALDANNRVLAQDTILSTSTLQPIVIYRDQTSGSLISRAAITFTGTVLVLDDLRMEWPASGLQHPAEPDATLLRAAPNPFQATVAVQYRVGERGATAPVLLSVYNPAGGRVADLVHSPQSGGWHTCAWNPGRRPNGVYILHLQAGGQTHVQPLVLMR